MEQHTISFTINPFIMTIINLVQNNYGTRHAAGPVPTLQSDHRFRLFSGWVSHLTHLSKRAGEETVRLQAGPAPAEQAQSLSELARLQQETTLGLERLSGLLANENKDQPSHQALTRPAAHHWVWYSLQIFFEQWNTETADFILWSLVRPVFCGERECTPKEKEEAAAFYELTKLLIGAAHALHQQHTQTSPALHNHEHQTTHS